METFGQHIRKARIDKRMMQKELGEKAKLSQKYLSEIELDKVDPRLSVARRIAAALGLSLNDLTTCKDA